MTGGISQASGLSHRSLSLILTATFAGWSGISVHCQVMTLCGGRGLSFKPYVIAKAVQGLLCGGIMAAILALRPTWIHPAEGTVVDAILAFTSLGNIPAPALLTDGAFIIGWVLSWANIWKRK
jgi:MFS family permease